MNNKKKQLREKIVETHVCLWLNENSKKPDM